MEYCNGDHVLDGSGGGTRQPSKSASGNGLKQASMHFSKDEFSPISNSSQLFDIEVNGSKVETELSNIVASSDMEIDHLEPVHHVLDQLINKVVSGNCGVTVSSGSNTMLRNSAESSAENSAVGISVDNESFEYETCVAKEVRQLVFHLVDCVSNSSFDPSCPRSVQSTMGSQDLPNIGAVQVLSTRTSTRKRVPKQALEYNEKENYAAKEKLTVVKEKVPMPETPVEWQLGDLVWAHVPGHPVWPCMITNDQEADEPICTKMVSAGGGKSCRAYHMQFLGDSPERGWVKEARVFSYSGPNDYERIVKQISTMSGAKKRKLKLEIPPRLKKDWLSAVEEIAEALPFSASARLEEYVYDFRPYIKKFKKCDTEEDDSEKSNLSKLLLADLNISDEASSPKSDCKVAEARCNIPEDDWVASLRKFKGEIGVSYSPRLRSAASLSPPESRRQSNDSRRRRCSAPAAVDVTPSKRLRVCLNMLSLKQCSELQDLHRKGGSPCSKYNIFHRLRRKDKLYEQQHDSITHHLLQTTAIEKASFEEKHQLLRRIYPLVHINDEFIDSTSDNLNKVMETKLRSTGVVNTKTCVSFDRSVHKLCTCTALQERRGLGENSYTLLNLLDAFECVTNGFPYTHVALLYNIPKFTLAEHIKKRPNLIVKHHPHCRLFCTGRSVVVQGCVNHLKAVESCRRLKIIDDSEGSARNDGTQSNSCRPSSSEPSTPSSHANKSDRLQIGKMSIDVGQVSEPTSLSETRSGKLIKPNSSNQETEVRSDIREFPAASGRHDEELIGKQSLDTKPGANSTKSSKTKSESNQATMKIKHLPLLKKQNCAKSEYMSSPNSTELHLTPKISERSRYPISGRYSEEDMHAAMQEFLFEKSRGTPVSLSSVAKKYNIPSSTLRDHVTLKRKYIRCSSKPVKNHTTKDSLSSMEDLKNVNELVKETKQLDTKNLSTNVKQQNVEKTKNLHAVCTKNNVPSSIVIDLTSIGTDDSYDVEGKAAKLIDEHISNCAAKTNQVAASHVNRLNTSRGKSSSVVKVNLIPEGTIEISDNVSMRKLSGNATTKALSAITTMEALSRVTATGASSTGATIREVSSSSTTRALSGYNRAKTPSVNTNARTPSKTVKTRASVGKGGERVQSTRKSPRTPTCNSTTISKLDPSATISKSSCTLMTREHPTAVNTTAFSNPTVILSSNVGTGDISNTSLARSFIHSTIVTPAIANGKTPLENVINKVSSVSAPRNTKHNNQATDRPSSIIMMRTTQPCTTNISANVQCGKSSAKLSTSNTSTRLQAYNSKALSTEGKACAQLCNDARVPYTNTTNDEKAGNATNSILSDSTVTGTGSVDGTILSPHGSTVTKYSAGNSEGSESSCCITSEATPAHVQRFVVRPSLAAHNIITKRKSTRATRFQPNPPRVFDSSVTSNNFSEWELQQAREEVQRLGNITSACRKYNIPRNILHERLFGKHKKKQEQQQKLAEEASMANTRLGAIGKKSLHDENDVVVIDDDDDDDVNAVTSTVQACSSSNTPIMQNRPRISPLGDLLSAQSTGGNIPTDHTEILESIGDVTEKEIANLLILSKLWGWEFDLPDLRDMIDQYIIDGEQKNSRRTSSAPARRLSENAFKNFCSRHHCSMLFANQVRRDRATIDPTVVGNFFDRLENNLKSLRLEGEPSRVYVIHEFKLTFADRVDVTVLAALSASGGKHPPLLVFSGDSLWCYPDSGAIYPGAQFALSIESNHASSRIFQQWYQRFIRANTDWPLLILYDGSLSRLPLHFLRDLPRSCVMLKVPYCSEEHDTGLPFSGLVRAVKAWYGMCRRTEATDSHVAATVGRVWKECLTKESIISAFYESGIFPPNRQIFMAADSTETPAASSIRSSSKLKEQQQQMEKLKEQKKGNSNKRSSKELNPPARIDETKRQVANAKNVDSLAAKRKLLVKNILMAKINKDKRKSNMQNGNRLRLRSKDQSQDDGSVSVPEKNVSSDEMSARFNVFCSENRAEIEAKHPLYADGKIDKILRGKWKKMGGVGKRRGSSDEQQPPPPRRKSLPASSSIGLDQSSPAKRRKKQSRTSLPEARVRGESENDGEVEPDAGGDVSYKCPLCGIMYKNSSSLMQHRRWCTVSSSDLKRNGDSISRLKAADKLQGGAAAADTVTSSTDVVDSTQYSFSCNGCQDRFFSSKSLKIHKKFCAANVVVGENDSSSSRGSNNNTSLRHDKDGDISSTAPAAVRRCRSRGPQLGSTAKKVNVCEKCEKEGDDLLVCMGGCHQSYHPNCIVRSTDALGEAHQFVCDNCKFGTHPCFICKKTSSGGDLGEIKRCSVANCGRYYHTVCLNLRKAAALEELEGDPAAADKRNGLALNSARCTLHHCATCLLKDIDAEIAISSAPATRRMFRCIRCPTAYHVGDDCIAAGSLLLSGLNIICTEHFEAVKSIPHHQPVHVSWCFICSKGGELVCCEGCPAAFHPSCVEIDKLPEDEWFCRDCVLRRRPLFGDIVWVKLGSYRWWPGQITHPNAIPDNIERIPHGVGEFVVQFYGSNDYFWLNRRRVFAYQEGDTAPSSGSCSRGISSVFNKALREAQKQFEELQNRRQQAEDARTQRNNKRPSYKHIKINRPVGNVQVYQAEHSEISRCICKRSDPRPCGPDSECLNRMLMFECHPTLCPAGDRCENQRFQKREYPESEIIKTAWGGWGLRSKVAIKKGEFVNEYVGELVDNEECLRRIEQAHKNNITNFYMLTIDKDRIIDAGPKGNFSRFMNHSCDPSCETQKWTVNGDTRVGLFAQRKIEPGEELTFNYNLDCLGNDKTPCMCGASNCSGFIGVRPKPRVPEGNGGSGARTKRKRKRIDPQSLPRHDDFCFRCRQMGTLVCCDVRGCQRAFCLSCLRLTKPPFGKWECPWHHCDFCGRRSQSFCHFCPNSFCASHVHNQLLSSMPNKFDCCTDHDPNVVEYEMEEAIAAVVAAMACQDGWEMIDPADPTQPVQSEKVVDQKDDVKLTIGRNAEDDAVVNGVISSKPVKNGGKPKRNRVSSPQVVAPDINTALALVRRPSSENRLTPDCQPEQSPRANDSSSQANQSTPTVKRSRGRPRKYSTSKIPVMDQQQTTVLNGSPSTFAVDNSQDDPKLRLSNSSPFFPDNERFVPGKRRRESSSTRNKPQPISRLIPQQPGERASGGNRATIADSGRVMIYTGAVRGDSRRGRKATIDLT